MWLLALSGCAWALVSNSQLQGQTSRTFLASSLRPLPAPKLSPHEHSSFVQSGATLHATVEAEVRQAPAVYVPKIGLGNVTEATSFPPPPPTLNPVTDYQPLDTAIGDYIQKQFVEPPTITPPPSQDMLSLYFACPLLVLPQRFYVDAPSGCSDTGRAGAWKDTDQNSLLSWAEKPQAVSDLDVTFQMPTNDGFGSMTAEFQLMSTKIDFIDCGLNVLYYMTEKVFHAPGHHDPALCDRYGVCDGAIFLKWEIWKQGGGMVAMTGLVTLFQDTFSFADAATGGTLVTYSRAAAWTPTEKCPGYEKEWVVSVGAGALGEPGVRWVLGMAITAISMRDETRNLEGIVRYSRTQAWSWGLAIAGIILGGALLVLLKYLFDRFFREHVTSSCIHIEDTLFPMTMYKNKSYT